MLTPKIEFAHVQLQHKVMYYGVHPSRDVFGSAITGLAAKKAGTPLPGLLGHRGKKGKRSYKV